MFYDFRWDDFIFCCPRGRGRSYSLFSFSVLLRLLGVKGFVNDAIFGLWVIDGYRTTFTIYNLQSTLLL